jgi:hypothetical protein
MRSRNKLPEAGHHLFADLEHDGVRSESIVFVQTLVLHCLGLMNCAGAVGSTIRWRMAIAVSELTVVTYKALAPAWDLARNRPCSASVPPADFSRPSHRSA